MSERDRRRYQRIPLDLPARIIINASEEQDARLLNISPGDMALLTDAKTVPGDAVIVRVRNLDIIEGTVARTFPDGFAVSFLLSKKRRALLTEQLMLRANPGFAEGLADRRSAPRHHGGDARAVCRLSDGTALYVKVLNISVDGVSVDAPRRPAVGSTIHIGRQRAVILRHTPRGFVALYETKVGAATAPAKRQAV